MIYVQYTCATCGKVYEARKRAYKRTCSDVCSSARLIESVRAMIEKRGPLYEHWLARTEAARQHAPRQHVKEVTS